MEAVPASETAGTTQVASAQLGLQKSHDALTKAIGEAKVEFMASRGIKAA